MARNDGRTELERTLRLLAIAALHGRPQKEQIWLLDRAGFGGSDIAVMVDSTPKAVSVRLAELRKAAKSRKALRNER